MEILGKIHTGMHTQTYRIQIHTDTHTSQIQLLYFTSTKFLKITFKIALI